jgi:hypothetical protein
MPLTPIDNALSQTAVLEFPNANPIVAAAFAGGGIHMTEIGRGARGRILFQFPPRVTSDNRSGEWNEGRLPGNEPVAVHKRDSPRQIRLEWEYIVGERGGADNRLWDVELVKSQVLSLRNYFSKEGDHDGSGNRLVGRFKLWKVGGNRPFCCRIESVDVSHGKTYIVPKVRGVPQPEYAYPLRTDIGIDLRLWTRGGEGGGPEGSEAADDGSGQIDLVRLGKCNSVPIDWM